jgi:ribosomal protein L24E
MLAEIQKLPGPAGVNSNLSNRLCLPARGSMYIRTYKCMLIYCERRVESVLSPRRVPKRLEFSPSRKNHMSTSKLKLSG